MRAAPALPDDDALWWRDAVIYQVYVRSFFDGNGDGVGDLAGVRSKLGYLHDLGIDAIWFTPWYPSPMADGGYDVANYRAIEPMFGTLAEAEELIAEALSLGIRTIIDVVPNHVSDQHPWFQQALAAAPGSPERSRFWFHPGRGADGAERPTQWVSSFSGDTWTRTVDADGAPGEWYLHLFTPEQPDLNWTNPDVWAEHEAVLRFWFDRGVAGIRIDSAALPVKDPALPELSDEVGQLEQIKQGRHPHLDRDELHDIYRSWRAVAETYPGTRVLVGEIWLEDAQRFARYLRPDEMHTAFNFDFMARPWQAKELRESITSTLAAHAPVGAPATWVLSNHDVTRPVTRYGRDDSSFSFAAKRFGVVTDLDRGARRARAAALLAAALPGSLYIYQGDELGLPEAEAIPLDLLQDPMHHRSGGSDPGRDGCRVPLPWTAQLRSLGFVAGSPEGSDQLGELPWLPQPRSWAGLSVATQLQDDDSMLWLYRTAIRLRREEPELGDGQLSWLDAGDDVLLFSRGPGFACMTNLGNEPVELPARCGVLLASGAVVGTVLPSDTTAWLRLPREPMTTTASRPHQERQ